MLIYNKWFTEIKRKVKLKMKKKYIINDDAEYDENKNYLKVRIY